ncbi:MAG: zinc-dependent metalloprotease, partial [Myxococcota bacterium]
HEVGHTLGLGHNFMGSLTDDGAGDPSSSIMEYVWRGERHRQKIGGYDAAAIRFGYGAPPVADVPPEDVPPYCIAIVNAGDPTRNAECSPWDGQVDPFGYFLSRTRRAVERAVRAEAPGQTPIWTTADLRAPLGQGLYGALFYASSAATSSDQWLRFHEQPGRPTQPEAIQQYVLDDVEEVMCGDWVIQHLEASYVLNNDAGAVAAGGWADLVQEAAQAREVLSLPASSCDPSALLSFDF